jgi:hypothetical protein
MAASLPRSGAFNALMPSIRNAFKERYMTSVTAEAPKRSRAKLPPRVTHYALVRPWKIYIEPAEGKDAKSMQQDGWMPIVADSNDDAEVIATIFFGRSNHVR